MYLELIIFFTNIINDFLFDVTWCIFTLCIFNIKNNTDSSLPVDLHDNCDMTIFVCVLEN